jgi:hypothetical protein
MQTYSWTVANRSHTDLGHYHTSRACSHCCHHLACAHNPQAARTLADIHPNSGEHDICSGVLCRPGLLSVGHHSDSACFSHLSANWRKYRRPVPMGSTMPGPASAAAPVRCGHLLASCCGTPSLALGPDFDSVGCFARKSRSAACSQPMRVCDRRLARSLGWVVGGVSGAGGRRL